MLKQELKFNWASCELSGYRKGFVTIKIDFTSNILSWKSSNHWYDNFVRGLPKSQMQPLYDCLTEFVLKHREEKVKKAIQPVPYVWLIQIGMDEEIVELQGYDVDSSAWKELVAAIEKVSHREFKL